MGSDAPQPQPDWAAAITTGQGLANTFDNAHFQPSLGIGGFAGLSNDQVSFWTFGANDGVSAPCSAQCCKLFAIGAAEVEMGLAVVPKKCPHDSAAGVQVWQPASKVSRCPKWWQALRAPSAGPAFLFNCLQGFAARRITWSSIRQPCISARLLAWLRKGCSCTQGHALAARKPLKVSVGLAVKAHHLS